MIKKQKKRRIFSRRAGLLPVLLGCFMLMFSSSSTFSQDSSGYAGVKARLVKTLKKRYIDRAFTQSIDHFYNITCDSLVNSNVVIEGKNISDILLKLFLTCEEKLRTRSISSLRIPSLNNYFLLTIATYKKQPLNKLYREINITQTAILQSAFDGLMLGDSIKTFVGLREMLNFSYYISSRIHMPRYERYKDTLLYLLANTSPGILIRRLADHDSLFMEMVKNSHNMTVKAVSQIVMDDYYEKILPFSLAIYEKRVSIDEIRKLSLSPETYYHAFIEEALRLYTDPDPQVSAYLKQPIASINRNLANIYYINEINRLHDSPDKTRFQSINGLPPKDLYFLLVGGSNQLYTSSFLYVYKKFLKDTETGGLDKFFEEVGFYQFEQFLSNVSSYGLVKDLVSHLKEETFANLMRTYFTKLQSRQIPDNEIILNAMTLSEVLYEVKNYQVIRDSLMAELDNFNNPNAQFDILLQRMYAGFRDLLLDRNHYNTDKTYNELSIDRLRKNNAIVQAYFFYDDEDGCNSFYSSTALFDRKTWERIDRENYVVFSSRLGNNMKVYMNRPMSSVGSESAQEEMFHDIEKEGYIVTSFVHRGHSYHLPQSMDMMTASAQFVFLGSCGGYNEVLKIFQLNPDVNVIVTRNIGSQLINDPLLHSIGREIQHNRDITWDIFWRQFNSRLKSKAAKDLFSSYIPPNRYIGIKFIRQVFNY